MGLPRLFIPGTLSLVIGLGVTCTIGYGTILYSFSLLSLEIEKAFGWSRAFIFGVYSIGVLLTGLLAPKIGKYLDRYGVRLPMCLGSILVAISLLGQASMSSKAEFLIYLLLMEAVSILVLYESAFVALTQALGESARKPISQITLIAGFASTIFWPIIEALLDVIDWRQVYLSMALLHLLVCLPLHWIVLNKSSWHEAWRRDSETRHRLHRGIHDKHTEVLISLAFGLSAFCIVGIQIHLFGIFAQLEISEKLAIIAGTLIGPFQVLSRLTDMILGRYITASQLGMISVGMMALGLTFSMLAGFVSPYAVVLFAVFFGMGQGLTNIVRGALPLQFFGDLNYGEITGRMNRIRLFMTAIAPVSFALIMSASGAMTILSLLCALCLLSIAFLNIATKRNTQLRQQRASQLST